MSKRCTKSGLILVLERGLFVALLLLAFALPVAASPAEPPKKILILCAEDSTLPGAMLLNQAIRSTLTKGSSVHVQYYSEAQDNFRIPNDRYEAEMVSLLRRKYEGEKIDLIFALIAPALKFLLKHRNELFPDTPIVFVAHDEREVAGVDFGPNVTGVVGKAELTPTMDIALALRPGTKRVVVVAGSSYQDRFWIAQAQEDFRAYQDRVQITYLSNTTIQDVSQKLASLPKDSIVLFLSFMLDSDGKSYSAPEALSLISPWSSAPIFGGVDTGLGHGTVGGRLLSYEALGGRAAELALRILAGEKAQDISIQTVPSVTLFDWRQLRRWGISEQSLPAGSIIRFKEPSFWQLYKWRIVGVISLCLIEALLIVGLLVNRARRKQAQMESARFAELARAQHRRLDEVVSNVPGMVWEISIEPSTGRRKTQFVSRFVEQMLGYRAEDFLSTAGFGLSLVHEDDRERVKRETNEIFATGTSGTIQYRWLTRDGRWIWVEAQLAAMRNEHDRPVGLHGVTMDITDRKLAEEAARQSEARNHDILRAIPDLMFLQTLEGVYLDYHAKEPRDLLVPPAEFLGKNMKDVLPSELSEELFSCFRRAVETDEPQVFEYSLPLQGEERWFEARMVRTKANQILSVLREVTDRKVTEAALSEQQAQLAGIISSAMDAIITVDESQQVVVFNDAAEKLFSCSSREAIGQPLDRFIPERFRAAHKDHIQAFGRTNVTKRSMGSPMAIFGRKKTGEDFPIEASISQINLNGKSFYTVILRDITRRDQAERALRESEERFAKAFSANPQPMSLTTLAEGRYIDVNDSFLKMSGYQREEVIGRTSLELGIWKTSAIRAEFMKQLRAHGIRNVETQFGTKDGSFRVFLSSAELVKIGDEQCVLVASSDITDRKQVEEAVRESEQRFRNMADTAPVMIWISGPDKLCTYFNKQWLDFTGRTIEQELGNGWAEGVYRDDFDRCLEIYNSAFDRKEPFRMEYRLRRADGQFRWVYDSGTPRFSSDRQFLGYIGSCIDIADRKEAEDAVRATKDELRLIADALPVLVSEVDKNGYYRFNNLAYEHWFGHPSDQITGHHMREVLGEAVWDRIQSQVADALSGQEVHYEDFLPYRHGGPRWVSVSGIPTRDADGEVNGFVSLVADITESRRAEEALRDLSGRLINAQEEERSRVARELHDDLSQRMAVLSIGLEQIAQQIPGAPGNLQGRIQDLQTKAQEISTEIHRLSYQLHPSKLDHLGLASAVKSFCAEHSAHHGLSIEFRQKGFPAPLPQDITLCVFRIVQESLHNVARHSGARGAQVVLEKTDQEVRLSVSDLGCGFDTDSNQMTSGLGFIGMRERLRLVGGELSIRSRPSHGTQIEVSVPLAKRAKRASVGSSSQNDQLVYGSGSH